MTRRPTPLAGPGAIGEDDSLSPVRLISRSPVGEAPAAPPINPRIVATALVAVKLCLVDREDGTEGGATAPLGG